MTVGNPSLSLFRPRQIILFTTTFLTLLTVLSVFETPRNSLKRNLPPTPSWMLNYGYTSTNTFIPEPIEPVNPLQVLSQLYEDERIHLLHNYDQEASEILVKTPSGALNPDFNAYISRLEDFVHIYFNGSAHHADLLQTLERLTKATPDRRGENTEFEKVVYSFDKFGREGVPPEYEWWERRLVPEGWEVKVGNDEGMEEWFQESAGIAFDPIVQVREEETEGFAAWKEMWEGLGRPVLKSDLLRCAVSDRKIRSSKLTYFQVSNDASERRFIHRFGHCPSLSSRFMGHSRTRPHTSRSHSTATRNAPPRTASRACRAGSRA
jgi:hypothetical protein